MSITNTIAVEDKIFSRLQVKETILLLGVSVLLPFLIHLLPELNGIPMGAVLLAMFFAPLIAVRFFKLHVALIIAFLSPLINFAIAGNPVAVLLPIMTFQLVLFVAGLKLLENVKSVRAVSSLISYLFCVLISTMLLAGFSGILPGSTPGQFLATSSLSAVPGIMLLVIADFTLRKFKKD